MKRLISALAAIFFAATLLCAPGSAASEPTLSAGCAVLMDADTGAVLYARHPDNPGLIASTTKIMTALLACQAGDLDRPVTIPAQAVGVEGSSLYLKEGETLTREELLYGTMLQSGNDAALALAIDVGGSEAAFVEQMNETARALGLQNTHYANPHGLDSEGNYSTARDLALLTAKALENPDFLRICGTKAVKVAGERALTNHNKLLWRCPGCIGVKTGYTKAAGRLLVSAARREGRTLICVTINDPADWQDHVSLLDWGFGRYEARTVAVKGETLLTAPGGTPLAAGTDLTLRLAPREEPRLVFCPGLCSDLLSGEAAGTVRIYLNGRQVAEIPVIWGESN
ncbi:MAG: D-alanyl-D-alanine carboxypeptidase [Oscillospiraceae bacterium]|nr:D-alanyl-D-alanine carboxypeptidase [Oscillospiraceae bacterium]